MSNHYYVNPDSFQYFDAPLKSVDENGLIQLNKKLAENKFFAIKTMAPHYYGKMGYIKTDRLYLSSLVLNNSYTQNERSVIGRTIQSAYDLPDTAATLDDYSIYYELERVGNKNWQNAGVNAPVVEVVSSISNHYYVNTEYVDTVGTMGVHDLRLTKATWTTEAYNDWYYLKTWKVYNRKTNENARRQQIGSEAHNVYPCIPWDIDGIYYYDWDIPPIVKIYTGRAQGFSVLNLKNTFSMQEFAEWYYIQATRSKVDNTYLAEIIGKHESTLGNNIKIVAGVKANTSFDVKYKIPLTNGEYDYLYSIPTAYDAQIIFKSEEDFLALLADWGVKHATNNETDAQTLPAELFPDYDGGGGFVPDGGSSSGYDDDPTIPSIPSYSDNTSDSIDLTNPNITSLNAASAYALNLLQVKDVLNWLMTDSFINNISNLFSDKLSALNDLKIMPFDVVNHDTSHTENSAELALANVSTEIQCHKILPSYNCIINGGKINYTAYWGNFADYTAARYELYVPYGGIIELSPSHVVNCELSLKYAVDMMTGNATAVIYSNGVLVKTLPCQLGQSVPITFTNTNQRDIKNALAALNIVNNIGGVVANAAVGNVGGAVSAGLSTLGGAASAAMTNPLAYSSKGGFASGTSLLMPQNAFLIITRAQLAIPSNINTMMGRPSNIYNTIGAFEGSGFVQIRTSHINTTATTEEQQEIISLLSSGIFL